jgi:hypothetical protein
LLKDREARSTARTRPRSRPGAGLQSSLILVLSGQGRRNRWAQYARVYPGSRIVGVLRGIRTAPRRKNMRARTNLVPSLATGRTESACSAGSGRPRGPCRSAAEAAPGETAMRRFAIRFALPVLAAFSVVPAEALGPGNFFSLIRNTLRFLWAEEGSDLDPNGRPASQPERYRWIWESTGSSIDPNGGPVPPPSGLAWLGAEEGSSIDPNGRPLPPAQWPSGDGSDR